MMGKMNNWGNTNKRNFVGCALKTSVVPALPVVPIVPVDTINVGAKTCSTLDVLEFPWVSLKEVLLSLMG